MKLFSCALLLLTAWSGAAVAAPAASEPAAWSSPDGNVTAAPRALFQFDAADYFPAQLPAGAGFTGGMAVRRGRLGLGGTLFQDWSYEFLYDLGGTTATVSSAWLQYNGFGPVHLKLGIFAPPESFEDCIAAGDLLFLERAQPADLARGIAGSDGREAATLYAYDARYFAALSLAGATTVDPASSGQRALVGRFAWRLWQGEDSNLALGADSTYVFQIPASGAGHALRLRERPELNVDSQGLRLIDTGSIDADHLVEWGVEAAGNWRNLYAQGGRFGFAVTRSALADTALGGWYAQASWVLSGQAKPYRADRGAYGAPAPGQDGWGAWEIAARYSSLDLDDRPGAPDGIRGGIQRIWSLGLNWYPNRAVRALLDYQYTDVSRRAAADARLGALSLRLQTAF